MKRIFIGFLIVFFCVFVQAQHSLFYGPERLMSSLITSLAQDNDGLLWVGTEQGLSSFDGYRFLSHRLTGEGDVSRNVSSLLIDNEGRLWVGTAAGLHLRDRNTDTLQPVQFPDGIKPRVATLLQLPNGRMLAGTAGYGLFTVDLDSLIARRLSGYAPTPADDNYYNRLSYAADGSVWKSGTDNRVIRRRPNGKLELYLAAGQPETFYECNGKMEMGLDPYICSTTDSEGNIYLGTWGDGLYWIPKGETRIRRREIEVDGINMNRARISALLVDHAGNLWAGCQQRGLVMIPLHDKPIFQLWNFSSQNMATGSCVSSVAEGDDGITWCVVRGDGVYGFNATGRVVAHPAAPVGVETLYRKRDGGYMLGTTNALYRYDPTNGQTQQLLNTGERHVNAIAELPDGKLAVSAYGDGFYIIDDRTGTQLQHLTMNDTDTTGRGRLCNNWIFTMTTDRDGHLWLGTSSGTNQYDVRKNTFHTVEGWTVMNENMPCTAMCLLQNGKMLLANDIDMEPSISYMTQDKAGGVWISTARGLFYRMAKDSLPGEPVFGGEFVRGAGLHCNDGRIILGVADGLMVFHPDSLRHRQGLPSCRVHLTALRIGGETASMLTLSGHRRVMDAPVSESRHFSFAYSESNFQLDFSLLDFANVPGTNFEYRLDKDPHWQRVPGGENSVTFNHLAPGLYRLQVRGIVAGVRTEIEEYVLEVRHPWWRSMWAYIIYIMLFILAVVLLAVFYRRHLRHEADSEKLRFLLSAIHNDDMPLTLDEMRKAVNGFVQTRKRQRGIYGNTEVMADRMEVPEVRGNDEALMDRIIQSVNQHLADSEFTVEQLCSEAGISRAQLHRKMKDLTGVSTSEFIRGIRLEQAARLLREQKLNITQVAYTVGFSSAAHFSNVFKKHFNVSPSEFIGQKTQV